MRRRKHHEKHKPHGLPILDKPVEPAGKTGQGQEQGKAAPTPAAQEKREAPYTRKEYGALMHGYHVGDPVTAARKQPPTSSQDWNPQHPTEGVIAYIHPDGLFAVVEFEGKSGKYRETFYAYELAHRET